MSPHRSAASLLTRGRATPTSSQPDCTAWSAVVITAVLPSRLLWRYISNTGLTLFTYLVT